MFVIYPDPQFLKYPELQILSEASTVSRRRKALNSPENLMSGNDCRRQAKNGSDNSETM